jgi:hypothetical protein
MQNVECCHAIKVGSCNSPALKNYLGEQEIAWEAVIVRAGTNINWEGHLWVVRNIDLANQRVMIFNEFTNDERVLSIEACTPSIMYQ